MIFIIYCVFAMKHKIAVFMFLMLAIVAVLLIFWPHYKNNGDSGIYVGNDVG